MKINYLGIVAAFACFASLSLSWITLTMTAYGAPIKMQFTVYLWQIHGIINGVSANTSLSVWFGGSALLMMMAAGVCCLAGVLLASRKGRVLLLAAWILALSALVVFGAGFLSSNYANSDLEPQSVMNLFPQNTFEISVGTAMQYGYNFAWFLSYGFWVALGSTILAFAAAVVPSLKSKKPTSDSELTAT